jgi:hypothetical protein
MGAPLTVSIDYLRSNSKWTTNVVQYMSKMNLSRRYHIHQIAFISLLNLGILFLSFLWPFIRLALWEKLRPIIGILDMSVTLFVYTCWALSVLVWFWLADASWLKRAVLASGALALSLTIVTVLGVGFGFFWSILIGI